MVVWAYIGSDISSVVQALALIICIRDVERGQMIVTSISSGQVDPWLLGAVDSLEHCGLLPRACRLAGHTQDHGPEYDLQVFRH